MQADDLIIFSVCLSEHFPNQVDPDGERCWAQAKRFSLATAKEAIIRHRKELGANIARPNPVRIGSLCVMIDGESKQSLLDSSQSEIREQNANCHAIREQHEADDALVATMNETEYDELVAEVKMRNPGFPDWMRPRGRTIMGLVCARKRELQKFVNAIQID